MYNCTLRINKGASFIIVLESVMKTMVMITMMIMMSRLVAGAAERDAVVIRHVDDVVHEGGVGQQGCQASHVLM